MLESVRIVWNVRKFKKMLEKCDLTKFWKLIGGTIKPLYNVHPWGSKRV